MDIANLEKISEQIEKIIPDGIEPSPEELDYDDEMIELYHQLPKKP